MDKKFCPFINGLCRDDCVFKWRNVAIDRRISNCLIAVKLSEISDIQHDVLSEILQEVKK